MKSEVSWWSCWAPGLFSYSYEDLFNKYDKCFGSEVMGGKNWNGLTCRALEFKGLLWDPSSTTNTNTDFYLQKPHSSTIISDSVFVSLISHKLSAHLNSSSICPERLGLFFTAYQLRPTFPALSGNLLNCDVQWCSNTECIEKTEESLALQLCRIDRRSLASDKNLIST